MRPDPSLADLPLRPELIGEEPYGAPQLAVEVQLNVNENPFAPSAEIAADMAATLTAAARRAGVAYGTAREYLERVKRKYAEVGRPAYTKLDLAERVREDRLEGDGLT